jgi:hypothetical protein
MDFRPEKEIEEPPSCAGGSVKVGAPASGTAGGGVGSAVAGAPGVGELEGVPEPPGSGMGMPGIDGVV